MQNMPHKPSAGPDPAGFTLVEVLIAGVLASVTMVSVGWAMSAAASTKSILGDSISTAVVLAREIHALADALPRAPSGSVAARDASEVLALDSLDGAVFKPPLRADGSRETALPGWEQRVDLALYSLDDLQTATTEDPRDGVDPQSRRLYQLRVTVLEDGAEVDTFVWWIRP